MGFIQDFDNIVPFSFPLLKQEKGSSLYAVCTAMTLNFFFQIDKLTTKFLFCFLIHKNFIPRLKKIHVLIIHHFFLNVQFSSDAKIPFTSFQIQVLKIFSRFFNITEQRNRYY